MGESAVIQFTGVDRYGRPLIVLGMSDTDFEVLKAGGHAFASVDAGGPAAVSVIVTFGPTERAIYQALSKDGIVSAPSPFGEGEYPI
jgi:hypothetical protein